MPLPEWSKKGTVEKRPCVSKNSEKNQCEKKNFAMKRFKPMRDENAKMSRAPTPAAFFDDFIRGP